MKVNRISTILPTKQTAKQAIRRAVLPLATACLTIAGASAQDVFQKQAEPIKIEKDMSVDYVQIYGNEAQEVAARLFDLDKSGEYDKNEAEAFNEHTVTLKKGVNGAADTLTAVSKAGNEVTIIYDDEAQLEGAIIGDGEYDQYYALEYNLPSAEAQIYNAARIIVDNTKDKVIINGAENSYIRSGFKETEINSSKIKQAYILANREGIPSLKLDNVTGVNGQPVEVIFDNSYIHFEQDDNSFSIRRRQ